MTTEYQENIEEAAGIARAAIPLATRLNLPVNPVNYTVLYEHVAGHNPKLSKELDKLQESPDRLTVESVYSLYQLFISQTDEAAIEAFREALGKIVKTTSGSLDKVSSESDAYQEYLGSAFEELSSEKSPTTFLPVIQKLIEETANMRSASLTLRDELTAAHDEIEKLRAEFKRVKHESMLDPLTAIKNRRAFDIALSESCNLASEQNKPICLLIMDIDDFKKINDTHGHTAGDAVLKWVARMISQAIRGSDLPARYGGEEFAILLPDTTLDGAQNVAENIRRKLCEQRLRLAEKTIGTVTASLGVAEFQAQENQEGFISRADEAMYRAKQGGRNCVRVAK